MKRLTDEQFEAIVSGEADVPAQLKGSAEFAARLAEHRALRDRLPRAFANIHAGDALAEKIRQALHATDAPAADA